MNDPAASGRGIRQGFLFKSRSQRDAGPELKHLSLLVNIIKANDYCLLPLRLVATGYETHWWESRFSGGRISMLNN
ncbi:MAG: hypothetical protein IID17_13715 [Nitrospinae bacterium]|nr:hypothetical protein [Nitrospinota bacterium]